MSFEVLHRISYNRSINICLILLGVAIAPYMFLFQFARSIFDKTDFWLLLLISFCIGLPLCLILSLLNIFGNISVDENSEFDKVLEESIHQMGASSLMIGMGLYAPCIWKYFDPGLDQRAAIYLSIAFLTTTFVGAFSALMKRLKKDKASISKAN